MSIDSQPAPDCRRWLVLLSFCLLAFSAAFQWIAFATVFEQTKLYFHMTSLEVNWLSMVYTAGYPCIAFLSCLTLEHLGLKANLIIGAVINAVGATIKFISPFTAPTFWMLMLAQTVNAGVQISLSSVPPLLAAHWFSDQERTLATAIGATTANVGMAFGMLIPPMIVSGGNTTALSQSTLHQEFINLFGFQFGMCALALVLVLVIPKHPRVPPSVAAVVSEEHHHHTHHVLAEDGEVRPSTEQKRVEEANVNESSALLGSERVVVEPTLGKVNNSDEADIAPVDEEGPGLLQQTVTLMTGNSSFVLMLCSAAIGLGATTALSSLLAELLLPFGISETDSGWAGFSSLIGGTVLSYAAGVVVDRKRIYKVPLTFCLGGSALFVAAMLAVVIVGDASVARIGSLILYPLSASFLNAALPLYYEYGLECSFPIAESIPSTLLMAISNASSFALTMTLTTILGDSPSRGGATIGLIVLLSLLIAGTLLLILMKEKRKRFEFESLQKTLQLTS
jgi:FLVCR family feline leukemia virus subgroup C receptor-related protein